MIARDEASLLPGLLQSVRGVVDRIVLVDTGSTDETALIAKKAGAIVLHHRWQGSFAEARNAALAQVQAGWILVMDADERLAPGAGRALKFAIARGNFSVGMMPLFNASRLDASPEEVLSGKALLNPPIRLPRLLKWDPELKWEGVIHENVASWLQNGRKTAEVEAPILHLGYVPELVEARAKRSRNISLLLERAKQEPLNPVPLTHLAFEYFSTGEDLKADQVLDNAWLLLKQAFEEKKSPAAINLITMRAQRLLNSGKIEEADTALKLVVANSVPHPNLDWLQAKILTSRILKRNSSIQPDTDPRPTHDLIQGAEAAFTKALRQQGLVFAEALVDGVCSWRSLCDQGELYLLLHRYKEAQYCFAEALEERIQPVPLLQDPVKLGWLEASIRLGDFTVASELEAALPEALGRKGLADYWVVLATLCVELGGFKDARTFLEKIQRPALWLSLVRCQLATLLPLELAFRSGHLIAGPGPYGCVSALLVGQRPSLLPEVAQLLGPVRALVAQDKLELIDRLLGPEAEQRLPGITGRVVPVLEGLGLEWSG
jgi:tetratricopeptide (TPR) repeat protein